MRSKDPRQLVFSRTGKSKCSGCPFNAHKRVPGGAYIRNIGKVAVVAEAPGREEAQAGRPFVGPAGQFLQRSTSQVGFTWAGTYQMNVINCRPPKNKINTADALTAIKKCESGLRAEIEFAVAAGVRVFVALGQTSLAAFDVTDASITRARGSVYEVYIGDQLVHVIPTFHPSYLIRGNMREEATFLTDLAKAQKIAREGWERPDEDFYVFPTLAEVHQFVETAEREGVSIACDIETAGGLGPDSYTKMIGFALDESRALCVPITAQSGKPYWKEQEWQQVRLLVQRLLSLPTIWQNCLFDVPRLRADGFDIPNIEHDVMLMHHALYSELPHRLDYVTSIYGKTPYWKDARQMSFRAAEAMDDDEFRTYNLRDCVVLHQVLPELEAELRKEGVEWAYQQNMALVPVVEHLQERGLLLDAERLPVYRKELEDDIAECLTELRALDVSEHLNFKSVQDKIFLFYGKKPTKYEKAKEVVETAKRKDTKKYAAALATVDAIDQTTTLRLPRTYRPVISRSGGYSTDDASIDSMYRALRARIAAIDEMTRPTEVHLEEHVALERSYNVLETYAKYQKLTTELGLYTNFPVHGDGYVKGSYVIHGTSTGRLSSRNPNMQNIKKRAKDIFISSPGTTFIEADYSNLELRVLAEISDDEVLRDIFSRGINVHDANTHALFALEPEDELWEAARRAAKTYIFGRNYGGGVPGIYKRVSKQVPELRLSLADFKEADARYRAKHPAYDRWKDELVAQVTRTRTLTNAFGRRRVFLGDYKEIIREGLNFPIQSTAADILNIALCSIYNNLPPYTRIALTVHDSIVLEAETARTNDAIDFLRSHMESTYTIAGNQVQFPVDIKTGTRLGSLKEALLDTATNR